MTMIDDPDDLEDPDVPDDTDNDTYNDPDDPYDQSYLVIKAKEVKIVKEVIRSDGLWRFACFDVYILLAWCDPRK